jgi:hypothetical protein
VLGFLRQPNLQKRYATCDVLLVIILALVLDREYGHGIQHRLEAIKREVAACTEINHDLTQIVAILNQTPDRRRMPKRHESLADGQHRALGRIDILAGDKCLEP